MQPHIAKSSESGLDGGEHGPSLGERFVATTGSATAGPATTGVCNGLRSSGVAFLAAGSGPEISLIKGKGVGLY